MDRFSLLVVHRAFSACVERTLLPRIWCFEFPGKFSHSRTPWPAAVMIVALRISTAGLGWRWYVDGYCGPVPPAVSCAAPVVAGAGGGAEVVCRAPPPAEAHAVKTSADATIT